MKPCETTQRLTEMKPSRTWLIARGVAAALLILAATTACAGTTAGAGGTDSGIQGTVTYGPTCPVQHVGGPSCVRPYSAEIAVRQGTRTVTTFHSAANGAFRVSLQPGTYSLASTRTGLPTLKPLDVTVQPHTYTTITVMFDSGIR